MDLPIEGIDAHVYVVPTDRPEADGTLSWTSTTMVVANVWAGPWRGLGWSYTSRGAAACITDLLAPVVTRMDAMATGDLWESMNRAIRNVGHAGVAMMALSAVDVALWDLKARALGLPLYRLLPSVRTAIPVYGSGGFTSYDTGTLEHQMRSWVDGGIRMVKMKIGREDAGNPGRIRTVRRTVGNDVQLFIDANGCFTPSSALAVAAMVHGENVRWFEEPVSSDDLAGMRRVREQVPTGMEVAAGEYAWSAIDFRRMLEAQSVDVIQADATRCGGISGFLAASALADSFGIPLSAHTAPYLHLHACCACRNFRHLEYFHDHVRIEQLFLDGADGPVSGSLHPDGSRAGHGLAMKLQVAEPYRVF